MSRLARAFSNQAPVFAACLFGLCCCVFLWRGPGIQYDEAVSVHGAVVLVTGNGACESPMVLKLGRHCWRLMLAPYVGAGKDYLAAPLFLLFGVRVAVARLAATILVIVCILGWSIFLRNQVSPAAGALTAFALAINPTLLDQSLFDSGNIALSLALLGLAAYAGTRFLKSGHIAWSCALGFILGIGVWSRLNFVWIIGSVALGLLIEFREALFGGALWNRRKALVAAALGFLPGIAPLLYYQWRDPSALRGFLQQNETYHNLPEFYAFLIYRLRMLGEVLFSDAEHRAIWSAHPDFGAIGSLSAWISLVPVIWCLVDRRCVSTSAKWIRSLAVALVCLTIILLTTRMPVAEHHLVILIPFAIPCVASFFLEMWERADWRRTIAIAAALTYTAAALTLQVRAASAIHRTRGLGQWSDAINTVYRSLVHDPGKEHLQILDWGLAENLVFLSQSALAPAEVFWGANAANSGPGLPWRQEVAKGGLFLTTSDANRFFPGPTAAFQKALRESQASYTLEQFAGRNGDSYALLYRVQPAPSETPIP